MPRRTFAVMAAMVAIAATAACIDVPDSMKAQFAPAGPNDKTNYRPGNHGMAPPPVEVQIPDASAPPSDLDASTPVASVEGGSV